MKLAIRNRNRKPNRFLKEPALEELGTGTAGNQFGACAKNHLEPEPDRTGPNLNWNRWEPEPVRTGTGGNWNR